MGSSLATMQVMVTSDEVLFEGLRKLYMGYLLRGDERSAHEVRMKPREVFERLFDSYLQLYTEQGVGIKQGVMQ